MEPSSSIRADASARPIPQAQTQWVTAESRDAIAGLGGLLQSRRKARGISLRQMANMAATSLGTVMRIEAGTNRRPEILSLVAVSNVVELRPNDLARFFRDFKIGHLQWRQDASGGFIPGVGTVFHPRSATAAGSSIWETEAARLGREALGQAFVHRREELGMPATLAAARAKVSLPFVSRVEKARVQMPEFFPLVSLGEVLGFGLSDIVRILSEGSREH